MSKRKHPKGRDWQEKRWAALAGPVQVRTLEPWELARRSRETRAQRQLRIFGSRYARD